MEVWILQKWDGNSVQIEGSEILGVFSTEELAALRRKQLPKNTYYAWYEIESHSVIDKGN